MSHCDHQPVSALQRPILWIHGEALGPANPALQAHPQAPAVFVFDSDLIEASGLSLKRLGFLYECLLELPVTMRRGDVAREVLAFAARHRADGVITTAAVDPRFGLLHKAIATQLPVEVLRAAPFVELVDATRGDPQGRPSQDLGRFSRYWKRAEPRVWDHWRQAGPGKASTINQAD